MLTPRLLDLLKEPGRQAIIFMVCINVAAIPEEVRRLVTKGRVACFSMPKRGLPDKLPRAIVGFIKAEGAASD